MPAPLPHATALDVRLDVEDEDAFYPSTDGKPMAENTWQAEAIMNAASDLAVALPEPFVAADILVYPERGHRCNSIAPDVLVAFGVGRYHRHHYRVWTEGKPPDWVLEVASHSTQARDRNYKRCYYESMGVPEYWLFDPKGDIYPRGVSRLTGLKLVAGKYQPLQPSVVGGMPMVRSEVLGLGVRLEDGLLRFRDPASGQDIRHHGEAEAAVEAAAAERRAAEARSERAQAQAEQTQAEAERAQAEAEREASRAQARIRELEALVQSLQAGSGDSAR